MWLKRPGAKDASKIGKNPSERSLEEAIRNSLIIIDKNSGPTSHQVGSWLREILGVKKAGHMGTLDPAVTGVLPVAIENATKAMPMLIGADKEYVGIMHVHKEFEEGNLRKTIEEFIGKINQLPPKKSAVARRMREREIFFFNILEISGNDVVFHTKTEAGTYIRKLVHDIGQKMGTGAHMAELRRVKAGKFSEKDSHSLVEVKDAYEFAKQGNEEKLRSILISIEDAVPEEMKVVVKDSAIPPISHGSPLYVSGIISARKEIERGDMVSMMSGRGEIVGIGVAKLTGEEMMKRKKGEAVKTDRVMISTMNKDF